MLRTGTEKGLEGILIADASEHWMIEKRYRNFKSYRPSFSRKCRFYILVYSLV